MSGGLKLPQYKFNQGAFNTLIETQGIKLILNKVSICPNRRSIEQESHNINCTICDSGYIYYDNVDFTGILQTSGLEKIFKDAGTWATGTAILTAPSGIRFDYFDKIKVPGAKGRFNQLIKRDTDSNIDKAHFKINTVFNLVDSGNKNYNINADYVINNQGMIEWVSNTKPQDGQIYSISYEYTPCFVVLEHLNFVRDMEQNGQKNLPQRVLIRLDYLTEFNSFNQGEND